MFVVDRHHKVLRAWAECRQNISVPPRLLSLDFHTDTSAPFRNYLHRKSMGYAIDERAERKKLIERIDFRKLETVEEAISKLNNDEHVVTAIRADFFLAHLSSRTTPEIPKKTFLWNIKSFVEPSTHIP